jgi:hypothetical protein
MIRALVDEDNVMPLADFAAQVRGRHDSSAAATQYYDLLSPVASSHDPTRSNSFSHPNVGASGWRAPLDFSASAGAKAVVRLGLHR